MVQAHGISVRSHLLPQHHVEIAKQAPGDAGLVHVHGAHAVVASLRLQPGHLLALPVHAEGDALGGVVGAEQRLAPLITKLIGAERVGVARLEHCAPLLAVVAHLIDAEGAHRHPEVGQQAPQPDGTQGARLEREVEQQARQQPEADYIGDKTSPAERSLLAITEAEQAAPQHAQQQWQQGLDGGAGLQSLPAQARDLGHQRHQHQRQRHEDGIEIGGAHRERAQVQRLEHHGVEGAEQHAGTGHAEQQDGGAEQPLL
ncbi:hypothetical protein D3C84_338140 [compost metagenome]